MSRANRIICEEVDLEHPPSVGAEGKFEDLGHKMIAGVEIRGERSVYYSSAAAKASGAAPVRMYENWCSMELDTPMGHSTLSEHPKREITTTISDVLRVDSEEELFKIPEGYKIVNVEPSVKGADAKAAEAPPKT